MRGKDCPRSSPPSKSSTTRPMTPMMIDPERVRYDDAADAEVIRGEARTIPSTGTGSATAGWGRIGVPCRRRRDGKGGPAWRASPRSSTKYAEDYPQGPHDKPQSMCPAFGSLRVGLRMRRTGDPCCPVRPLRLRPDLRQPFSTARRRSVGYVPFNSETLRHPPAVRGTSATRSTRWPTPKALRRDRGHQNSVCRPRPASPPPAAAGRRSTASGSSASTCPDFGIPTPRRGQGCPGPCDAQLRPPRKWRVAPVQAPFGQIRPSDSPPCWGRRCSLRTLWVSEGCSRHSVWRQVPGRSLPWSGRAALFRRWTARWWPRSTPSTPAAIR